MRRLCGHKAVIAGLCLGALSVHSVCGQSRIDGKKLVLPDFDARDSTSLPEEAKTMLERRHAGVVSLLAEPGGSGSGLRIVPNRYGLPKTLFREGRTLSAPSSQEPEEIARTFLRANSRLFELTSAEVDDLRLVVKDVSGGAVFLTFIQTLNGIDVFNGQIKLTLNAAGEVAHAGADEVVPHLSVSSSARLSAEDAVRAAFQTSGINPAALSAVAGPEGKASFRNPRGDRFTPVTAELSIFPMTAASARLAYRIFLEADRQGWYEILIDAESGGLLYRHNLYAAAQGRVWIQSPMDTSRPLTPFQSGWIPANGTVTTGNNTDAYLDLYGEDQPDSITSATLNNGRASSSNQIFDFPFTSAVNPRAFQAAALTNLFYFINTAHDYYYGLGFNEAAGNFQTNNFGKGGLGNDAVLAEVQQDSLLDNALFAPTVEGTAPKIRMGIFTRGTDSLEDDLDSSYDGQVVMHEYGHGVSNRLVGGGVSVSCLNGVQSSALGEGWSDYFSISFYNNPIEGAYLSQNKATGLRRHSYEGYLLTYEDIGNQGYEAHNDGEIWAAALWDLRKSLSQDVSDRLVLNALKSTPCHPSMTDARDAILAADLATNHGANRAKIWQVFAKHGLGFSATGSDGNSYPGIIYNAAYDQPIDLQPGGNPAITSKPPSALPRMGDQYSYTVTASNPAGGVLAYTLAQGPPGMTIAANGVLHWTAGFTQQRVKITVTDGRGGKVVHGFVLTPDTPLTIGASVTIAGAQGEVGYANFVAPAGGPILQATLRDGAGDPDLQLIDPDGMLAGFSSRSGSTETLSIARPKAGQWRIAVSGFKSFSRVSLGASIITPTTLPGNTTLKNLSGSLSSETFYKMTIPPAATSLTITVQDNGGNTLLSVQPGVPGVCQWSLDVVGPCDFSFPFIPPFTSTISPLTVGDWYFDLYGFADYSGVSLTTSLGPAALGLSLSTIAFDAGEGAAAPPAQSFSLFDVSGSSYPWTAQASTGSGGNWLRISKMSGTGDTSVQVTVDQTGLKQGTYQGQIVVTSATLGPSPQSIQVTLNVTVKPALTVGATSIAFQTVSGQNPPAQSLGISSTGGSSLSWMAAIATVTGGNWLMVSPSSGTGTAMAQVSVDAASLAAGSYSAVIVISASGATNSPVIVPVTITIAPAGVAMGSPRILPGGVAGAGLSVPAVRQISPNGLIQISGENLAPAGTVRTAGPADLVDEQLPTNMSGVCVQVGDRLASLLAVAPGILKAQVPALSGSGLVGVQVVAGCGSGAEARSNIENVQFQSESPEFFFWNHGSDGMNAIAATDADTGEAIGTPGLLPDLALIPAKPGGLVTLTMTGLGLTTPPLAAGQFPEQQAATVDGVRVMIGEVTVDDGDIIYAGAMVGQPGVYQVTLRVPGAAPDGNLPVTVQIGGFSTPAGGYLTVMGQAAQ
jgi:uncharacterized protein (TIGR03437 family)